MLRAQIEDYMKLNNIKQIDLVYNEDDKLAIYCTLRAGKLYDYTGHVVDRKKDIWGYLKWTNGTPERRKW